MEIDFLDANSRASSGVELVDQVIQLEFILLIESVSMYTTQSTVGIHWTSTLKR